jgi:hypothetical protein
VESLTAMRARVSEVEERSLAAAEGTGVPAGRKRAHEGDDLLLLPPAQK